MNDWPSLVGYLAGGLSGLFLVLIAIEALSNLVSEMSGE